MSKAILVIDMPQHCGECICQQYSLCKAIEPIGFVLKEHKTFRPDWCPLKTLPNPIDISGCETEITKARAQEYNALLAKLIN